MTHSHDRSRNSLSGATVGTLQNAPRRGRRMLAMIAVGLAGCSANLASGPPSDSGPTLAPIEAPQAIASPAPATTPAAGAPAAMAAAKVDADRPRARSAADLAKASAENPGDATLAMAYVRVLKSTGKRIEALAVLDAASEANPDQAALNVEQGLLALELGQSGKAHGALQKAAQGPPDWRVMSGLGIAASSQGQQREAQRYFARALELSPNNPVVLNNLAMSLVLDRKVDQAEAMLRRAAKAGGTRHQVAQNLALTKVLKSEPVTEEMP